MSIIKELLELPSILPPLRSTTPPPQLRRTTAAATRSVLDLSTPLAAERDFFGHDGRYLREHLPPEALEILRPPHVEPLPLRYTDENLNLAAAYVARYAETRLFREWFEIGVAAVAFPSFLAALREEEEEGKRDGGTVDLLAFSCWCDAGGEMKARHRQHRHLVVSASPRLRFERRIWSRVGTTDRPRSSGYACKWRRAIRSPLDLIETLSFLAGRITRCRRPGDDGRSGQRRQQHFHILRTLPENHLLPLAVACEGGLSELLRRRILSKVRPNVLVKSGLRHVDERWVQRLGDFRGLPRGRALPLDRRHVPVVEGIATAYHVHLLDGRRLHFARLPEPLPEEAWLALQGPATFFECVGDATWIPGPRTQAILDLLMPRVVHIDRLRRELRTGGRGTTTTPPPPPTPPPPCTKDTRRKRRR